MSYINRFGDECIKPEGLSFNYSIGDVVKKDGIVLVITGFGIYDNWYWTEKIDENGCSLCRGDYVYIYKSGNVTDKEKNNAIEEYMKALKINYTRYPWLKEISLKHIKSFKSKLKGAKL